MFQELNVIVHVQRISLGDTHGAHERLEQHGSDVSDESFHD